MVLTGVMVGRHSHSFELRKPALPSTTAADRALESDRLALLEAPTPTPSPRGGRGSCTLAGRCGQSGMQAARSTVPVH